ncbi:hypothetical protein, partial [Ralstonia solanacearum]|uniref:hypothetical protein n=1 Tax=Ralstonia solanacearum TaxID=305 RepID=UPI001E4DEE09
PTADIGATSREYRLAGAGPMSAIIMPGTTFLWIELASAFCRVAYVPFARLASLITHRLKRRFGSKSGNRSGQIFVLGVAVLLLNLTILIAMPTVQSWLFHRCPLGMVAGNQTTCRNTPAPSSANISPICWR